MKVFYDRSDVKSVLFVATALAATAVQWSGLARHPALYAASLCFAFFACVIDHNHQHRPVFHARSANRVFGVLVTLAIGQPASAIVPMHVLNHHVHNNDDEDFVRASIVGFRWKLLNLVLFPFVALRGYARVKSRDLREWGRRRPGLYRQLILERWALYPVAAALLVAAPLDTLVFVVAPWLYGQWGILAVNHVQHAGCDPESPYNHTRNFTGRWLNWWTFNNGYHTAHHLRPALHWSRLPELHAELEPHLDPRLQYRSMLAAVARLYLWPAARPALEKGAS